jgi:Uma2 family endonuclease
MTDFPVLLKYKNFRFEDDEFYDFCLQNDQLKFERDANGNIIVMPNTGGKTGKRNAALNAEVYFWNKTFPLGIVFDSSTAFKLPSSAVRSPDVAWVSRQRWEALSASEQEKFPPLCPDFVIELISASDNEAEAKIKMTDDWLANGCRLAWLINPFEQTAYIYRPNIEVEQIVGFDKKLSGEGVLPNFELDLSVLK